MTDRLREAFEELVAGEPPPRLTADAVVAAGRQARRRHRSTVAAVGTAALVVMAVGVPGVLRAGGPGFLFSGDTAGCVASEPAVASEPPVTPTATANLPISADPPASADPSDSAAGQFAPAPLAQASPGAAPTSTGEPCASPTETTSVSATVAPSSASALPVKQLCFASGDYPYGTDATQLPDEQAALDAVAATGPQLAPGLSFIVHSAQTLDGSGPKLSGIPELDLVFDIGDDQNGYGSLNLQITPGSGGTPWEHAAQFLTGDGCSEVQALTFDDGSIGTFEVGNQASDDLMIWYFGINGVMFNMGMFPYAWPSGYNTDGGEVTPSALPARGSMPLSVEQVMRLADAIAHS